MARKPRVQYPGAMYHVMNRGDRREPIFKDNQDRLRFIETLGEACAKTGWQIHAWCLMPNHFHLVIETPQPNLVAGMKWLLSTYTSRFNRRHKEFGHLFSGRYKALIVDGSGNGYLKTVCDYVHLNPVRAKMLKREQPMRSFPWSSLQGYLRKPRKRPAWLRVDRLLGEHGIARDSDAGRRHFEQGMELRRQSEDKDEFKPLKRGWCIGDKAFRLELLQAMKQRSKEHDYAEPDGTEEECALEVIRQGLKRLRWTEQDLARARKGDPGKVQLALRLRKETAMTIKWIAANLHMGSWQNVNNLLYLQRLHSSK